MNILGVIFDLKLQWTDHISHSIKRSMKALNAIRLIHKFFTKRELLSLITSNIYSILYYNSEVWHLPSLKTNLKQSLLSASARALRICNRTNNYYVSFNNLHAACDRANPEMICLYKMALSLFNLYNNDYKPLEFALLNFNQILTGRQTNFISLKSNVRKVGINCLANRLTVINNKIPLDWLNLSLNTYKINCKKTVSQVLNMQPFKI